MRATIIASLLSVTLCISDAPAQKKPPFVGADENTPSKAHFFDWINSQYEGTTEDQTLINLGFFKWLHDEYGMGLDIYALDVGNIDDGPYTAGVGRLIPHHYGNFDEGEFAKKFPNGFGPLVKKAASFGCRLGIWLGPDGFGENPGEEKKRTDLLISFCRDFNFISFKLDAVAGDLRPEKQDALIKTLEACRAFCPDLLVLNHRVKLGKALPYATTSLWEGEETYIDVFMNNSGTATHHRVGSMARGLTPDMTRRMEDHGVCLSSCLDYWEDELILQAFNRSLLLAPELYGNPWFLRDDEYPKLARIFNLHRRYGDILVSGIRLPEDECGPFAVSRGDGSTRFVTLRNLTWNTVTYSLTLDGSIGLDKQPSVEVRRFHPTERVMGRFAWGTRITVEVLPFRSCLIAASTRPINEIGMAGCDYEVVRDRPGKPLIIRLLGMPGTKAKIRLEPGGYMVTSGELDGVVEARLAGGKDLPISFPGKTLKKSWHRKIGALEPCPIPGDAEALYEATCYAADNNALEVRSVQRSGQSLISEVNASREAFFTKKMFVNRGIWDRQLFDGNLGTYFTARLEGRALRVDFGEPIVLDHLAFRLRDREEPDLNPELSSFAEDAAAEVSADLKNWTSLEPFWKGKGTIGVAEVPPDHPVRYLRFHGAPRRLAEVEGYHDGGKLDRSLWRASNLFTSYPKDTAVAAWSMSFVPDEIPKNAYLVVAVSGHHGNEGAYAALRVDGQPVGAPDRATSFPSNTWEYYNVESDSNYSYYFPLPSAYLGKKIDVVVLIMKGGVNEVKPEAWMTAYPIPYEAHTVVVNTKQ